MPLSEHEQKLLEQMERALYAEDPKFATSMKGARNSRIARRRAGIGVTVAIFGLGLVIAGVTLGYVWLGGIGFAVMVAGVAWAFTPSRGGDDTTEVPRSGPGRKPRAPKPGRKQGGGSSSFMQRMEGRWEDRRRSQGQ